MDKTMKRVVAMLFSGIPETQCASAKVLGELEIEAPEAIKALGEAASDSDIKVRCAALEALGKCQRMDGLRYILPHLTSSKLAERNRAISSAVALGPHVLPSVVKELSNNESVSRGILLIILQRFPIEQSIEYLLQVIPDIEIDAINQVCEDFNKKISSCSDDLRQSLAETIRKWASRPIIRRNEQALIGGLRLLNPLKYDKAFSLFLRVLESESSSDRAIREAFSGMGKLDIPSKEHEKLWRTAAKILRQDTNPTLVQAATEICKRIDIPSNAGKELIPLLEHRDTSVQHFAVNQLSGLGTKEAGAALVKCINTDDWRLREEIVQGLRKCSDVGDVLVKEFGTIEDQELAGKISQIIIDLGTKFTSKQFKNLFEKGMELQEIEPSRSSSIFSLLSSLDLDAFKKAVLTNGKKLIKDCDYEKASSTLGLMRGRGAQSDEGKYLLAVTRFKLSNKGLSLAERQSNKSLAKFSELIEFDGIDLAGLLIEDKEILDKTELYYLGFHFVEQMGKLRKFGGKLLDHVVKISPRSKEGKDAKNKLNICGFKINGES